MRDPIAKALQCKRTLIIDGGLCTALEEAGLGTPSHPLWTAVHVLQNPMAIQAAHLAYLEAGADIILSASYQATPQGLMQAGYSAAVARAALRATMQLARAARAQFQSERGPEHALPLIATSIGPYGAYRADGSEFRGDDGLSPSALADFHRPRLEILLGESPQLLALETIPSLREALAFLGLLEELDRELPCWVSFSCRDKRSLSDGTPFAEAIAEVTAHPQVVAAGINCSAQESIQALLESVDEAHATPLLAYPNAGGLWNAREGRWESGTANPGGLASAAARWTAAGADLLGGCCQTGPEDTRLLAAQLSRP